MAALPAARTLPTITIRTTDELPAARAAKGNAAMIPTNNKNIASKPSADVSPPKQVPGASDPNPVITRTLQRSKPTAIISIAAQSAWMSVGESLQINI